MSYTPKTYKIFSINGHAPEFYGFDEETPVFFSLEKAKQVASDRTKQLIGLGRRVSGETEMTFARGELLRNTGVGVYVEFVIQDSTGRLYREEVFRAARGKPTWEIDEIWDGHGSWSADFGDEDSPVFKLIQNVHRTRSDAVWDVKRIIELVVGHGWRKGFGTIHYQVSTADGSAHHTGSYTERELREQWDELIAAERRSVFRDGHSVYLDNWEEEHGKEEGWDEEVEP